LDKNLIITRIWSFCFLGFVHSLVIKKPVAFWEKLGGVQAPAELYQPESNIHIDDCEVKQYGSTVM
jgi:hypothetical protein